MQCMTGLNNILHQMYPFLNVELTSEIKSNLSFISDFLKQHAQCNQPVNSKTEAIKKENDEPLTYQLLNTQHCNNEEQHQREEQLPQLDSDLTDSLSRTSPLENISDYELLPPACFEVANQTITCSMCKNNGWKVCEPVSSDEKITSALCEFRFNLKEHLQSPKHLKLASDPEILRIESFIALMRSNLYGALRQKYENSEALDTAG